MSTNTTRKFRINRKKCLNGVSTPLIHPVLNIALINDSKTQSLSDKEAELKVIFAKYNIEIEFYN